MNGSCEGASCARRATSSRKPEIRYDEVRSHVSVTLISNLLSSLVRTQAKARKRTHARARTVRRIPVPAQGHRNPRVRDRRGYLARRCKPADASAGSCEGVYIPDIVKLGVTLA